jgi:hypothetical protein
MYDLNRRQCDWPVPSMGASDQTRFGHAIFMVQLNIVVNSVFVLDTLRAHSLHIDHAFRTRFICFL